jgi:hypothetical protein
MATSPRSFRLTNEDLTRLSNLQAALGGTETDIIRTGLSALEGITRHGLKSWTLANADGQRVLHLPRSSGGALMLLENEQGGYEPWQPFPTAVWGADLYKESGDD